MMTDILHIDPAFEEQKIENFLRDGLVSLNAKGVVIGLSGGLDSSTCAYIIGRVLRKEKIFALILPERDSDPANIKHARMVAKELGIESQEIDITPILKEIGIYDLFPHAMTSQKNVVSIMQNLSKVLATRSLFSSGFSLLYGTNKSPVTNIANKFLSPYIGKFPAFAFTKVRLRMIFLYYYAMRKNFAVVGTTDKSEWKIGFFDKYGDAANDITLLRHLYKTQIRELARFLHVPNEIIQKPSSADVIAGLPNEQFIGFSYEQLDKILYCLDHGYADQKIIEISSASQQDIDSIKLAIATNAKRQNTPIALD